MATETKAIIDYKRRTGLCNWDYNVNVQSVKRSFHPMQQTQRRPKQRKVRNAANARMQSKHKRYFCPFLHFVRSRLRQLRICVLFLRYLRQKVHKSLALCCVCWPGWKLGFNNLYATGSCAFSASDNRGQIASSMLNAFSLLSMQHKEQWAKLKACTGRRNLTELTWFRS